VPLFAAPPAGESREFRVTVVPQNGSTPSFQTLEQAASAAAKNVAANHQQNCQPRLSLQREGDRVTSIRVQCSCGQVMDLACVYDEPPKAS
jgi:hypothetical protein